MTSAAESEREPRVVAVVVAYNRSALLSQALDGLAAQLRRPAAVVVVDNASTDDSGAVAAAHSAVTEVVTMPCNTGGAGGFAAGIARAVVTHRADLVWIMDDDTVPGPSALLELLRARSAYRGTPAVLASRADWHDGREHPMNAPRERVGVSRELRDNALAVGAKQIRSSSFVSILIDSRAVREDGLPEAGYFLWNDDFEYTARLLRDRVGLYVPASRVTHLTKVFGASNADPGPRFFNEVRNKLWLFTRSDALGAADRVLYAGSSLRRWAATLARSDDRRALLGHLRRGVSAAAEPPPSTSEVLAGTPVEGDVRAILSEVSHA
ncbi:MAG TPA: glycosyltransferase [Actinomycetaceae bacterium]|nr:glycosyltransferase [Actinomycetaceae bacterium]